MSDSEHSRAYRQAGVDVDKGTRLVEWLKTGEGHRSSPGLGEVVAGIGGFAGLFRPNFGGMSRPLLVACTDGVGTKVLLATEHNSLDGIGEDLVAMCVNDLYTLGGVPLFFLDYYATGKLQEDQFKRVLVGIKRGLASCGAALLGGETAEMPGLYGEGHFDLAGFVVGVVDEAKTLGPHLVQPTDLLYAFPSSGFHSNGYSLLRSWLNQDKAQASDAKLIAKLLRPTRIYHEIPTLLARLPEGALHALAHITGGGLAENLARVLPAGVTANISYAKLPTESWMRDFLRSNNMPMKDAERVFNLGVGIVAAVSQATADSFQKLAAELGLSPQLIGNLCQGRGKASVNLV